MAAQPNKPPGPVHEYNGEASILSAHLVQPLEDDIRPQAHVTLPKNGRYQFKKIYGGLDRRIAKLNRG